MMFHFSLGERGRGMRGAVTAQPRGAVNCYSERSGNATVTVVPSRGPLTNVIVPV